MNPFGPFLLYLNLLEQVTLQMAHHYRRWEQLWLPMDLPEVPPLQKPQGSRRR